MDTALDRNLQARSIKRIDCIGSDHFPKADRRLIAALVAPLDMTPEPVLGDKQGFIDTSMARTRAKPEAMKVCNELSDYSLASYPKHEIFRLASVLGRIP